MRGRCGRAGVDVAREAPRLLPLRGGGGGAHDPPQAHAPQVPSDPGAVQARPDHRGADAVGGGHADGHMLDDAGQGLVVRRPVWLLRGRIRQPEPLPGHPRAHPLHGVWHAAQVAQHARGVPGQHPRRRAHVHQLQEVPHGPPHGPGRGRRGRRRSHGIRGPPHQQHLHQAHVGVPTDPLLRPPPRAGQAQAPRPGRRPKLALHPGRRRPRPALLGPPVLPLPRLLLPPGGRPAPDGRPLHRRALRLCGRAGDLLLLRRPQLDHLQRRVSRGTPRLPAHPWHAAARPPPHRPGVLPAPLPPHLLGVGHLDLHHLPRHGALREVQAQELLRDQGSAHQVQAAAELRRRRARHEQEQRRRAQPRVERDGVTEQRRGQRLRWRAHRGVWQCLSAPAALGDGASLAGVTALLLVLA